MLLVLVFCIIALLVVFYYHRSRNVNYWKSKGVPTAPGCHWFFGHYKPILFSQKHLGTVFEEIYDSFPESPVVGFLKMSQPGLVVKDPDIIKAILTTDFTSFNRNDISVDKKNDKLFGNNPFVHYGEEWKTSRALSTSSVTFAKLKNYFPVFLHVGDELVNYVRKACQDSGVTQLESKQFLIQIPSLPYMEELIPKSDQVIHIGWIRSLRYRGRMLAGMFTTDTISNAIYGLDNNTFENKESLFATLTREILTSSTLENIKFMINFIFPEVSSFIGIRFSSKRSEEVLTSLTKRMMEERADTNSTRIRTDIFQQMIQNRQSGKADVYTDDFITGHLFAFLLDGYETSSILIAYALFELAWHQDVQNKLRTEINEMISRTNGNYKVEDVENLKYLDMVVSESVRLNVPVMVIMKRCTSDYTISGLQGISRPVEINKGTVVAISVSSLHMDPNYFPSPKKFDPDRFSDEEVANRHKFVFLPFGEGPRKCLGQRFGVLQSKVAIIKTIQHFYLSPSSKSSYPSKIDPNVFLVRKPLNGAWINFRSINIMK